jgi:hypothetical protein
MNEIDRDMLIIRALAEDAKLLFSEYTKKWYVSAGASIGDGVMLRGIVEHRETPAEAVEAYMQRVRRLNLDEYIATEFRGHRREWRWNGAAFAECTRPEVFAQELERAK